VTVRDENSFSSKVFTLSQCLQNVVNIYFTFFEKYLWKCFKERKYFIQTVGTVIGTIRTKTTLKTEIFRKFHAHVNRKENKDRELACALFYNSRTQRLKVIHV
jgi:hypothetical protein